MTMKPENNILTEVELAIDADTGQWMETPHSEVVSIPVLGFANEPEAEMRMLRADMDDCFHTVRALLDRSGLTFEQELEIYNRVPLGKRAHDIPETDLIALIEGVRHD